MLVAVLVVLLGDALAMLQGAVVCQLLVNLLHSLDVDATGGGMIHHRQGVVFADDALRGALDVVGGSPWLMDVLDGHVFQDR